jgi:hypothetical protein
MPLIAIVRTIVTVFSIGYLHSSGIFGQIKFFAILHVIMIKYLIRIPRIYRILRILNILPSLSCLRSGFPGFTG